MGWFLVLCILLLRSASLFPQYISPIFEVEGSIISASDRLPLIDILFILEAICFIEVGRIAIGQLKGNLILGVVLHLIRMSCLLLVLPGGLSGTDDNNNILSILVLYSWSLTEVGRYPMYIFPSSTVARNVRLALPVFTFPVGAAAEAIGAYRVLTQILEDGGTPVTYWVKIGSLGMVILINSLLGPTMAYPALLKKGLPVLMGKTERKKSKHS